MLELRGIHRTENLFLSRWEFDRWKLGPVLREVSNGALHGCPDAEREQERRLADRLGASDVGVVLLVREKPDIEDARRVLTGCLASMTTATW